MVWNLWERKVFKKIEANKIKNVDGFIDQLKNIINNKTVLLKTTVIVKLNNIISDLKEKSGMDEVDQYMKHLKRDIGSLKTILKTISANQSDSHQTLMKLLN